MSQGIMKKSAIALAVTGGLFAANVSAELAQAVAVTKHYSETAVSLQDIQTKAPSAHMIVLKATTSVDMVNQGTYSAAKGSASIAAIEMAQREVAFELSSLDFNAKVIGRTKVLASSLIVEATPEALDAIAKDARVERVLPMFDSELHIAASADYIKATPVVSSSVATGATQKVAVLDTGIDYTHAIFGGEGTVEAYEAAQSDPASVAWPQGQVKGGYDFMRDDADPIENDPAFGDPESAPTGHGTSVSHSVTGIAPEVELYVYSVCGGGCPGAAQAAALEAAMDPNGDGDISDRVDVINMSLGGEFGDTWTGGGTQYLIQRAVDLGVNMVISAGNDGDHPFRIGGPSTTPNALSVGAMTHPANEIAAGSGQVAGEETVVQGASFGPQTAFEFTNETIELVYPDMNQTACEDFADGVDFTGKAVLLDRGACAFVTKVLVAQAKGAAFVIIANNNDDGTPAPMGGSSDAVTIPSVGINYAAGMALKDAAAPEFAFKVELKKTAGAVAGFSSRGPSMDGLLKPEITAPGTSILVAATGTQDQLAPATGTSFSGPMTAGAVALIREALPDRNAFEIKATIMNSANLNVTNEPLEINPESELAPISMIGAGLVDVEKAVNLPVAAWVHHAEFDTNQAALSFGLEVLTETTSMTKTVTVKNFSKEEKTYNLRTEARYSNDDESGALMWNIPASVTVPAGKSVNFDVTLTIDPAKLPEWTLENPFSADDLAARSPALTSSEFDGALVFDDPATDGDHDLHVVYHVLPKAATALTVNAEVVNDKVQWVVENTGFTDVTPIAENLVAKADADASKDFNILSTTFNALALDGCSTGVLVTASIKMRDAVAHLRQVGAQMLFDIDNDGRFDYAFANYNDVGRSAAIPGRSRTVSGPIVDDVINWTYVTPMYHSSGSDTVTFSACSDLIGLTADQLGSPINIHASVGYPSYTLGVYYETDNLSGSTAFASPTSVALLSTADGSTMVNTLAPGEKAIVSADSSFALNTNSLQDIVQVVTASDLASLPSIASPMLEDASFEVSETAANGTVIGQLVIKESALDLDVVEYYVHSQTTQGVSVNNNGEVVVTDTDFLDYDKGDKEITLKVVAIDKQGNASDAATVMIMLTNELDEASEQPVVPEPPKVYKKSSGSLGWFVLLAAPFAWLRRRKQK